jgi:diamine N-acetyltransferase
VRSGERVNLRLVEECDLGNLLRWRNDPSIACNFFGWQGLTPEGQARWFEAYQRDQTQRLWIIDAGARPVGCVGLSDIDWLHRRAELGRTLVEPAHQGRGYATEAVRRVADLAFTRMGLGRLYLHVFADNEAAITLYKLVGFRHEGLLRAHVWKDGHFRDVMVMGRLSGEGEAR